MTCRPAGYRRPVDVLAPILAAIALGVSVWSVVIAKRSADAADRSADAAERQAVAAEASVPRPPPAVAWRVARHGVGLDFLRNVGTDEATGVRRVEAPSSNEDLVRFDAGRWVRSRRAGPSSSLC
jgi:hypothetical protein